MNVHILLMSAGTPCPTCRSLSGPLKFSKRTPITCMPCSSVKVYTHLRTPSQSNMRSFLLESRPSTFSANEAPTFAKFTTTCLRLKGRPFSSTVPSDLALLKKTAPAPEPRPTGRMSEEESGFGAAALFGFGIINEVVCAPLLCTSPPSFSFFAGGSSVASTLHAFWIASLAAPALRRLSIRAITSSAVFIPDSSLVDIFVSQSGPTGTTLTCALNLLMKALGTMFCFGSSMATNGPNSFQLWKLNKNSCVSCLIVCFMWSNSLSGDPNNFKFAHSFCVLLLHKNTYPFSLPVRTVALGSSLSRASSLPPASTSTPEAASGFSPSATSSSPYDGTSASAASQLSISPASSSGRSSKASWKSAPASAASSTCTASSSTTAGSSASSAGAAKSSWDSDISATKVSSSPR
mmetsp:Transcript_110780/g.213363  ORF Transcript_110780/g.213363 Transcript_110780/m.213363 type:complete len:407 (-) Transcript_110780:1000-2220(-)